MGRWLSIVGIGEDGLDGLGGAARTLVAGAELVVGGRRHLSLAAPLINGRTLAWTSPIEDRLFDILAARNRPVVVLASGDPFHFGIGTLLAQHVATDEIVCLPQPSSFSLAASELGWSLQDTALLSVHGRPLERVIPHLQPGRKLLALAWDGESAAKLATLLIGRGFGRSTLHVLEALRGPNQRIISSAAHAFGNVRTAALSIIGIECQAEPGARIISLSPGLPDEWFQNDGQLTKREVRAVTLAALEPKQGQRLWDIGGGAGSIAIEWLLRHESLSAISIEKNRDRARSIALNAADFGVPHLTIIEGEAPAVLVGLPAPDAVFIGGGTSNEALMDACWLALPPGGRLVANAVTHEGGEMLARRAALHGGEVIRLAIERLKPVGGFRAWKPSMPVIQWAVTK
ncbi:MAG: precorrin-6y C5,15-methyltransferase (decarboxylating) subunit CbiE [Beijerinckiaceae bacterium]|nr:precorrin-6y C5,15-methyltransferase (decarboxylating) subunit CbiE [Beijerinckiaceae bacterium]